MKNKILAIASILLLSLTFIPLPTYALDLGQGLTKKAATKAGYSAGTNETTLASTIGQVIKTAMSFLGILFTALMVYAGFLWMTARGEEGQIDKAQKIISYSIMGLILALGSYSITNFVVPRILESTTGENIGTLGAPEIPDPPPVQ